MRRKQLVAVSAVEHPSVLAAFRALGEQGHEVRFIASDASGAPDWRAIECALSEGASLLSFMQVNNETGALLDLEKLRALASAAALDGQRALIHVDGVQGFLRVPIDFRLCDLYTLSAHKIHGPKGVGALICQSAVKLTPRQIGGGQEEELRSGTENTPGIAGLYEAVREMRALGADMPDSLMQKKLALIAAFRAAVPGLLINGPEPERAAPHIVNISFPGVRGETMLHALEADGVYASTGSACSSRKRKVSAVLTAMGISPERAECALRFSLSPHTSIAEIERAAASIEKNYELLRKFQRR